MVIKHLYYIFFGIILLMSSCNSEEATIPKPKGFLRIDFPEKKFETFLSDCPFLFEIPVYAEVETKSNRPEELCNKNIQFTQFNGTLHLTYKKLNNDLARYIEDCHNMVYQHTVKAFDISTKQYLNDSLKVYGLTYNIKGNAASPLQFYLTDSSSHFIRGALYFNTKPNYDSIQPVLDFIKIDINHFVETFSWKNTN